VGVIDCGLIVGVTVDTEWLLWTSCTEAFCLLLDSFLKVGVLHTRMKGKWKSCTYSAVDVHCSIIPCSLSRFNPILVNRDECKAAVHGHSHHLSLTQVTLHLAWHCDWLCKHGVLCEGWQSKVGHCIFWRLPLSYSYSPS